MRTASRSSRHAKIAGDFGEALVLYLLSRCGFECARVDHVGIDLIAHNAHTEERIGISVKSRSRVIGNEHDALLIPADNFGKAQAACDAFGCSPYFAIVIDAPAGIRVFMLSMQHLLEMYPPSKSGISWKMSEKYLERYADDDNIKTFELRAGESRWW